MERPVGRRLEVVEQRGLAGADGLRQGLLLEGPGEVGGLDPAVDHRAGHAEAGRLGLRARRAFEEFRQDLLEGGVLPARERRLADRLEGLAVGLEEGEDGLRAADVAGQDHGRLSFEDRGRAGVARGLRVSILGVAGTRHGRSAALDRIIDVVLDPRTCHQLTTCRASCWATFMLSRKTGSGSRSESCRAISSAIGWGWTVTVRAATSTPDGATASRSPPSEANSRTPRLPRAAGDPDPADLRAGHRRAGRSGARPAREGPGTGRRSRRWAGACWPGRSSPAARPASRRSPRPG